MKFIFFMFSKLSLFCWIGIISLNIANAQTLKCLTGPLEGYRGENCRIERMPTADGFVYTYSAETAVLKQWNFETGKVEQEWPMTQAITFRGSSQDGRFLLVGCQITQGFWSSRLFDTQTGKFVSIENFGVFALLSNNLAVVRDDKRKVLLYDLKANKIIETLGKDNGKYIGVSANGNIIAWSEYTTGKVKVYDVSKGSLIFTAEVSHFDMPVSVSPDGRYVVWCGEIRDLKTNRTMKLDCKVDNLSNHQVLYAADGKTAYSIFSGRYSDYGSWTAVAVYVREYNLETGALIAEYKDTWSQNARITAYEGPLVAALAPDQEHIYFPSKSGVVLAHKSSFDKQKKSLDIFGSIGAVGLAQQQATEQRAKHVENLAAAASKTFENIITSNVTFQHDVQMSLWDYDPVSEYAMIGNVFEGGLFDTKTGQFITMYSRDVSRPGLAVKTDYSYCNYSVAPGGNLVAINGWEKSALYNRSTLVKEIQGVGILKLVNQRMAVAQSKSGMIGLFDLDKEQFVLNYRRFTEGLRYRLSPDRTKIMFIDGSKNNEVVDVATGKTLYRFDGYNGHLTNKYLVFTSQILTFIDIATGKSVEVAGWDPIRAGTNSQLVDNYILYTNKEGMVDAYDIDNLKYVSDLPVRSFGGLESGFIGALSNSQKLLVSTKFGSVAYGVDRNQKEYASAYTLDLKTGEVKPFRYHIPAAESAKRYADAAARMERERAERKAAENPGLLPCMYDLRIKPNTIVEHTLTGKKYIVRDYNCDAQNYRIEHRLNLSQALNEPFIVISKAELEAGYKRLGKSMCNECNGSGGYMRTVQYSNTYVDNYNAHVPGGKVVTTTSGTTQKRETCHVCKGIGVVE